MNTDEFSALLKTVSEVGFKYLKSTVGENGITIGDIKELCFAYLTELGFENPNLETSLMIEKVFGHRTNDLQLVSKAQKSEIEKYFEGFNSGNPIQRQRGYTLVKGSKINITDDTLWPGPSVDFLIDTCVENLKQANIDPDVIIDMCTGSGVLAIVLGKAFPDAAVYGFDISDKALDIARKNAYENAVNNVELLHSDMFESACQAGLKNSVDLIISNPPYLKTSDIGTLSTQFIRHTPMIALDGGVDGLKFHRIVVEESTNYLKPGGLLVLEIDPRQSQELEVLIDHTKNYEPVEIMKNHRGEEHIVVARKL
jgi:release factor glutamine methyltransferase